jgi:two-component system NtrC family sensor kinase
MRSSLRTKITATFLIIIVLSGIVTVWVGVKLVGDEIIQRAQHDVRFDLNSARQVYRSMANDVRDIVRMTSVRFFLRDALESNDLEFMGPEVERIRRAESLDILTVTDDKGIVLFRASNPPVFGDSRAADPIIARVLDSGEHQVATAILERSDLVKEGWALAERARIEIVPTPMAAPSADTVETSGMVVEAAAPIRSYDGRLIGVVYGARLLNRSYDIVDAVKDIVYGGEQYDGRETGTATIFQGDVRISTNVLGADGRRAIGTRVSREVYDRVVGKGGVWVGRAFVVNDWYITAYEPIRDLNGDIIGMLYVGGLEAPYTGLRERVAFTFLAIAVGTVALMSVVSYYLSGKIVTPLRKLVLAIERIAGGDLTQRVESHSGDEIGQLAGSFNRMSEELLKARERYQRLTDTLEDKVREKTGELERAQAQLLQSEKLTSLGRMAAGIAHEINNPLTSILINSHLVAEKIAGDEDLKESMDLIIEETARSGEIVRGLLEFSRQSAPEMKVANVNDVIERALMLLRTQTMAARVEVRKILGDDVPDSLIDPTKMGQAFTNLILNALDAMPEGGTLTVRSEVMEGGTEIAVAFADTGCGVPADEVSRIFDPFFTTKGTGTGLGLSITLGIIQQHGGRIEVRSAPAKGATFKVFLPAREKGA